MSVDVGVGDGRRLVYHAESDCYMETFSPEEYEQCFADGCSVEVTGYEVHEKEFMRREGLDI